MAVISSADFRQPYIPDDDRDAGGLLLPGHNYGGRPLDVGRRAGDGACYPEYG